MTLGTGIESNQENRTLAMVAYAVSFVSSFVGPLIVWLVKKEQSRFVAFHALQALLFNIVTLAAATIAVALGFLAFVLLPVVGIVHVVFLILAGIAALRGEWYEIPVIGKYARQAAG